MVLGKVGVAAGKFFPPHRGHLASIINAATQVEKLYVVVCDNPDFIRRKCAEVGLPEMPLILRAKWLSQELQGFDHIHVVMLDESGIPDYPAGWELWSERLLKLIPEHIDVMFGGEPEYEEFNKIYLPTTKYICFDPQRERYNVSGTKIRSNPLKYWDYILGSARPFFAKKILIAGSESCGKTTTTKYLAKMYHTSWSEEVGRYYSRDYLGGNEEVFTLDDFEKIAQLQYEQDMKALRTSNRIVFYDTDAVVTQFYCKKYLGETNPKIENWIDPSRYDILLMFTPEVKWVDDGLRWMSDDSIRWANHREIKRLYEERGFKNIIEIPGSYNELLIRSMEVIDDLLM